MLLNTLYIIVLNSVQLYVYRARRPYQPFVVLKIMGAIVLKQKYNTRLWVDP